MATARAGTPDDPSDEPPGRRPLAPLKMRKQGLFSANRLTQAPEYARPLRPHWVASLARAWDDQLVGELLISKRADGTYRLMTGNHRWAARLLRREGDKFFNCLVYYGLTVEEEARIYLAQDKNRLHHTAADDFTAMVKAGDPVAIGIDAMVRDLGLHIAPYANAGYGRTRIRAVSALLRGWQAAGADNLRDALELIRDEWLPHISGTSGTRRTAFSETTIVPMAVFLRLYRDDPDFTMANLRVSLDRDQLDGYERKYMAQRNTALARPSTSVATLYGVLALVDTYNYGRRQHRLDEAVARQNAQTRFGGVRSNSPYQSGVPGSTPMADARRFIEGLDRGEQGEGAE